LVYPVEASAGLLVYGVQAEKELSEVTLQSESLNRQILMYLR